MSSPSSDKYTNITLIVNGKAGVVVWIVYTTLVSDNRRFRYSMFFVIIVGNHGTQIPIIRTSIAPINEESLVHFGCINGHGSDRMRPGKGQRPWIFVIFRTIAGRLLSVLHGWVKPPNSTISVHFSVVEPFLIPLCFGYVLRN